MKRLFILIVSSALSVAYGADTKMTYRSIKDVKFEKFLNRIECTSDVNIESISFKKLNGLDDLVALIVGSTCMTGTAGPDIHAVYILENQYPKVMPFEDNKGIYGGIDYLAKLDGNRNSRYEVKDGQLQERWHDKWGTAFVTFTYKWNGKEFVVIDAMYKKNSMKGPL
ncbi:MAG: hypothetical protein IPK04_00055 [Bdellovibrionales bacterium]|nr:hypothetical protein [Bdellovibrionales bacterium]